MLTPSAFLAFLSLPATAAPGGADLPPTCAILEPTGVPPEVGGQHAEFYGEGADDVGVVRADFYVGETLVYSDDATPEPGDDGHFHCGGGHRMFDTTRFPDGGTVFRMVVTDTADQTCEASVYVGISNDDGRDPTVIDYCSTTGGTGLLALTLLAGLAHRRRKRTSA